MFHVVRTPFPPPLQAVCGQLMNIKMNSFCLLTCSLLSTRHPWIEPCTDTRIYHTNIFQLEFVPWRTPSLSANNTVRMYQTGQCYTGWWQLASYSVIFRKLWQVNVQLQEDTSAICYELYNTVGYCAVCGRTWCACNRKTPKNESILKFVKAFWLKCCHKASAQQLIWMLTWLYGAFCKNVSSCLPLCLSCGQRLQDDLS